MDEAPLEIEEVIGHRFNVVYYRIGEHLYRPVCKRKNREGKFVKYYTCSETKCQAKVTITDDVMKTYGYVHNHEPDVSAYLKMRMIGEIKTLLNITLDKPRAIFDRVSMKDEYVNYFFTSQLIDTISIKTTGTHLSLQKYDLKTSSVVFKN